MKTEKDVSLLVVIVDKEKNGEGDLRLDDAASLGVNLKEIWYRTLWA